MTIVEAADGATLSGLPTLPAERTRFWTIRPTTTCATMNTMKPQPMLQPTPHTPPKEPPSANTSQDASHIHT